MDGVDAAARGEHIPSTRRMRRPVRSVASSGAASSGAASSSSRDLISWSEGPSAHPFPAPPAAARLSLFGGSTPRELFPGIFRARLPDWEAVKNTGVVPELRTRQTPAEQEAEDAKHRAYHAFKTLAGPGSGIDRNDDEIVLAALAKAHDEHMWPAVAEPLLYTEKAKDRARGALRAIDYVRANRDIDVDALLRALAPHLRDYELSCRSVEPHDSEFLRHLPAERDASVNQFVGEFAALKSIAQLPVAERRATLRVFRRQMRAHLDIFATGRASLAHVEAVYEAHDGRPVLPATPHLIAESTPGCPSDHALHPLVAHYTAFVAPNYAPNDARADLSLPPRPRPPSTQRFRPTRASDWPLAIADYREEPWNDEPDDRSRLNEDGQPPGTLRPAGTAHQNPKSTARTPGTGSLIVPLVVTLTLGTAATAIGAACLAQSFKANVPSGEAKPPASHPPDNASASDSSTSDPHAAGDDRTE